MLTAARIPAWDELELRSRLSADTLELCLMRRGRLVAFSRARSRSEGRFRWLEPPVGLEWAVEVLREATDEWLRLRRTESAPARDAPDCP